MFTSNGSLPLNWKVILPIIICMFLLYIIVSIVKLGKTKVLTMSEAYHITPLRFEILKPLIMVYLYLSICFLLPMIVMPYVTGLLLIALMAIVFLYTKTWIRCGFSIISYVILNAAVLVLSIITSMILKVIITNIISYIGRYYNVI